MDFSLPADVEELRLRVAAFVRERIIPLETDRANYDAHENIAPQVLARMQQEVRAAGILNHPNLTAVHDIGTHDGAPYVVSELLEGATLRERLSGAGSPHATTTTPQSGASGVERGASSKRPGIMPRRERSRPGRDDGPTARGSRRAAS